MSDLFLRPWTGAPTVPLALDAPPRQPRRTGDGRLVGRAVRPSAGIRADYDARLRRLIDEMARSVDYWLIAAYRDADERIAALGADEYIRDEDGPGAECSSPASGDEAALSPRPPSGPSSLILQGGLDGDLGLAGSSVLPHSPGELALDARPSATLDETIRRLRRRWLGRFRDASEGLARYFAKAVWRRSDDELRKILKRGGFAVEMRISQSARDTLAAIVRENVSLIRSVPEQYLSQVEGSVMRSVLAGRDLRSLTEDLRHHHGVARRRAEMISRDQNNKCFAHIGRIQYLEVGITRAIWRHSAAGRTPRPSHVANDGREYDVAKGWLDPAIGKYIWPGTEINCRCFAMPILPR